MPGLRLPDLCCGVIEPQQNVTVAEQAREARFLEKPRCWGLLKRRTAVYPTDALIVAQDEHHANRQHEGQGRQRYAKQIQHQVHHVVKKCYTEDTAVGV